MMWWHDAGWGWGGWVLMTLLMLAFWALVVGAVVVLVRALRGGGGSRQDSEATPPGSALHVLDERFARGEIDAEEYTARRDLLLRRS
jgi:putative membrane protein